MSKFPINTNDFSFVLSVIKQARQKAYKYVNKTLIELYWEIGRFVSRKVINEQWGKSVIEDLATYIAQKEPNIKGFSARNIWSMKQFYETYAHLGEKLPTLLAEIGWSHNRRIMSLKTPEEREFYLKLCSKYRYSFRELERLINTSTYERTILANEKIPEIVKQLPQNVENVFKDSYIFDFLDLPIPHSEKDLQTALVNSLKEFILELGKGFSFIGQEYRIQVGNDDFYIDLLFFHRELQSLVAFELKTEKFKPEFLGQLEFYLEVLDRNEKLPNENPSIGVLLCREKNSEVVEYALSRVASPTLISEYETKLIPKELLRKKLNEFYQILESRQK